MVHAHTHRDHAAHHLKVRRDDDDQDVTVVYVTAKPDFDGPIGGYVTAGDETTTDSKPTAGVGAPVRPTHTSEEDSTATETKATTTEKPMTTATKEETTRTTKEDEPTETTRTTTKDDTTLVTSTVVPTTSSGDNDSLPLATSTYADQAASSTAGAVSAGSDSGGLSTGAKAGVAIGAVLGVALVAALIFFFVWKKKKQQEQGEMLDEPAASNEKYGAYSTPAPPGPPPSTQQPMAPSNPPQLNVRPITQFAPDLTPPHQAAAALPVAGATTAAAAAAGSRNLTGNPSPPQTPQSHTPQSSVSNRDPFRDPVNPFGNQAEAASPLAPNSTGPSASPSAPTAPAAAAQETAGPFAAAIGSAAAIAAVAGVAAAGVAATSEDKDLPSRPPSSESQTSIPGPTAPSPVSSIDGVSPAAMGVAPVPGQGPPPMPTNVHRVQMDFIPSMEDELELHAGQLVRLLHEYDDGWALCVRLDRSQQGVVPRSCLSARPVKPRARPPPGAGPGPPGPRGPPPGHPGPPGPPGPPGGPMMGSPRMPPSGPMQQPPRFYPQDGRPASPSRPMSPAHGGYGPPPSQQPRPMSPAQFPPVPRSYSPGPGPRAMPPRSMSPGPYGPPGLQRPDMPAAQRKRSNSTGGALGQSPRMGPAPGPSPLAAPMMPPPSGALPAIPTPPSGPSPTNEA